MGSMVLHLTSCIMVRLPSCARFVVRRERLMRERRHTPVFTTRTPSQLNGNANPEIARKTANRNTPACPPWPCTTQCINCGQHRGSRSDSGAYTIPASSASSFKSVVTRDIIPSTESCRLHQTVRLPHARCTELSLRTVQLERRCLVP